LRAWSQGVHLDRWRFPGSHHLVARSGLAEELVGWLLLVISEAWAIEPV